MYNKFAKGDLIKITRPTPIITYPVSANVEMWDNNELRTFENLNRPMRNLFENNQELHSIIKNLQSGLKMGGSSILNGCELVVSGTLDEKRYVSLTPGLFFHNNVSYSVYPTPSIASRQLEKDLNIYTEDGINYINITYENGKFNADINISGRPTVETISNVDRGINLLAKIKTKLTDAGFTVSKDLHEYTLEPCFKITSDKKFVNFNETTGAITLEDLPTTLSFGFVDNFDPTNNESANWEGLIESAYENNSVTNAKLADMAKDTLKGNNTDLGDPKDLNKADVVTMFNLVTRDAPQTIDGIKTFTEDQKINNTKKITFKNQTGETGWNISNSADNTLLLKEDDIKIISIAKDNGAMTIANPVSLSETLAVSGVSTLNNSLEVNASDAGEKIGLNGPTTITGITKIKGALTIEGTDDGDITTIKNPVALSDTLTVSGVSTLNNSLEVNASDDGEKIDLNGPTTITGITKIKGALTIEGTDDGDITTIKNPVALSDTLTVSGVSTLNNSLEVNASDDGEKIGLNGPTTITGDTDMTGKLTVIATATGKSIDFSGPTTITGNFTVNAKASGESVLIKGNTKIKSLVDGTIELETPTLSTTSKKFVIGSGSTSNTATNGSGIVFKSNTDKSFLWKNGTPEATASSFTSSENLNLATGKTYKIDDIDVLTSDTLGAEVINSALTKVGTISEGVWNGTPIAVVNGGTGQTSYSDGQILIGDTTGNTLKKGEITGTPNRITVAKGNGTITLDTPQDIHIGASPTFVDLTLTGNLAVNGSAITTDKTTLDVLNTNLTEVLNFANVATTINMGELANISIGKIANKDKTFKILNTTASTDSTTGALVVSGGVGIGGDVSIGGITNVAGKLTATGGFKTSGSTTTLEVGTNLISLTGDSKHLITDVQSFSVVKDTGATPNLLSVNHSGITANVPLSVSGKTTLNNSFEVSANADTEKIDLKGPTTITGATKIEGDLTIGDIADDNTTTINNPVVLKKTLSVSGKTTLNNSFEVSANNGTKKIDLKGPTTITGDTKIKGDLTIGDIADDNTTTINNPVELKKTLVVDGEVTLNNSFEVNANNGTKKIDLKGPTTITGDTKIKGDLIIGDTDDGNTTTINNPVELKETLVVDGDTKLGAIIGSGPTILNGETSTEKLTTTGAFAVNGPTTITGNFTVDAKVSGESVLIEGDTKIKGDLIIGDTDDGNTTIINNPVELKEALVVGGEVTLNEEQKIKNNTKLTFKNQTGEAEWNVSNNTSNTFSIKEGETERISIVENNGTMTIANPVKLKETLVVGGAVTLNNSFEVNANNGAKKIDLKGPTTITGDTKIKGDLIIGGIDDGNTTTINNPVELKETLVVTGATTLGEITGNGTTALNGETSTKNLTTTGVFAVNGFTTLNGDFTVFSGANGGDGKISMTGNTTIASKTDGFIELATPNLSTTSKTISLGLTKLNTGASAEDGGMIVKGTSDKSFLWNSDNWVSSENLNLVAGKTYKINDVDVLSSTTLGKSVKSSSLTEVGTITKGTWQGDAIAVANGGTGQTSYSDGQILIGDTTGDSNTLTKGFITGNDDGVIVSNGSGSIKLNTPQPIATTSSPEFEGLTITGTLSANGGSITTNKPTFDLLEDLTGTLNIANTAATIKMGEGANINIGKTNTNKTFKILNTTASTDSTTGALVVSGGVGIGGDVSIGGITNVAGKLTATGGFKTSDSTSTTTLEVATNGVNTTGNVKSTISSAKKFSIEKDTTGNLLSVKHSGITVDVPINSSKAITSTNIIKASKFETANIDTVSDINSEKFNGNTINNTMDTTSGDNISLLWVNGVGKEIKRTSFINFPVAVLNGSNGLMPASALSSIKQLQEAAGFVEGEGYSNSLLRVVNTKSSPEGDITLYSDDIKLKNDSVSHADEVDESTTSIYTAIRTLRNEKVRVSKHIPTGAIAQTPVGQIIKKTKNGTGVTWGQITDDEIETQLTKVKPSTSTGVKTTGTLHKVAFWNNNEESLLSHDDITYNTSTNTLIAETVSSRSSRKLKKDIELYEKSAFDTIDKIDIVSYHFIADETQTDRVGFIAEDSPELVSGKDRDHMEINNCIGLLLKAVQELKEENQELRKLINDRNS